MLSFTKTRAAALVAGLALPWLSFQAHAATPGTGQTAEFEVAYLKYTIDHHYGALRMTELAAGTQTTPLSPDISPADGTSPTPGTDAILPKADIDDIKSLARQANRTQREEILMAQQFLRDWYQIDYSPHLTQDAAQKIQILEAAAPGQSFDIAFLKNFSQHHYVLLGPSTACIVGADPVQHKALQRYCNTIWHAQTSEIDQMRGDLCSYFQICDYRPFKES